MRSAFLHLLVMMAFILTTSFASRALAAGSCIAQQRTAGLLKDFTWYVRSGATLSPFVPQDPCNRHLLESNVLEALMVMQDTPTPTNPPDIFDQGIIRENMYSYFKDRVKTIIIDSDNSKCESGTLASFSKQTGEGVVTICTIAKTQIYIDLVGLLMHEARHSDTGPHTTCSRGIDMGVGRCDYSYEDKGPYAVTAEIAVRNARDTRLPEILRQAARQKAYETWASKFNMPPFEMELGVVLIDEHNEAFFFDGKTLERHRHLRRSSDYFQSFFTLHSANLKSIQMYDIFEMAGRSCLLRDDLNATCTDLRGRKQVIHASSANSSSRFAWIQVPGENGYVPRKMAIITSSSDPILVIPDIGEATPSAGPETLPNQNRFTNAVILDYDRAYGLTEDGVVKSFKFWGDRAKVVPTLEGRRFKRMLGPIFSSKVLDDLQ